MVAVNPDELVGRVVGPYRVVERLNLGGRLPLYSAQHLYLDRQVAVRLLLAPEWSAVAGVTAGSLGGSLAGSLDRFLAEAYNVSRLKHENVLQLLDLGETGDGHIYLATELPGGRALDRTLEEQGAISGARVRRIARQIGLGLLAAAEGPLGPRDLSAEQVFLTTASDGSDRVKLDFATADMLAGKAAVPPDGVQTLGLLLYQMVVGQLPVAPANEAPLDPVLARPDLEIPADVDALIMRALDPDPAKRWPDLAAMLRVLAAGEKRTSASAADSVVRGSDPNLVPRRDFDFQSDTLMRRLSGRLFQTVPPRALIAGGVGFAVALIVFGLLVAARRDRRMQEAATTPAMPTPAVARQAPRPEAVAAVAPAGPGPMPGPEAIPVRPDDSGKLSGTTSGTTSGTPTAGSVRIAGPISGGAVGAVGAVSGGGPAHLVAASLARVMPEGGGTRPQTGAFLGAERGADGQSGTGTAPPPLPRDDDAKPAVASRSNRGDDACAVTLGSRPWSEVWIDGRQAGFTPLVDYPIDCGAHDIVFKSSQSHVEKRVPIVVTAGQSFKKTVDLAPNAACVVTLGSRPWSEVWIDGKKAGVTPLVEYQLACGKHEVLFRSNDANVERREAIVVQNGQPLKKVVALVQE